MNADVRFLLVVVFFMFIQCNAMETGSCRPFGMDIDSIEKMPKYCAELVKLLTKEQKYWSKDTRFLPTPTRYDGPICTLLNRWALQGNKKNLKVRYDPQAIDSYNMNFLYLKGTFDPCLLKDIEGKYRQKIEELQRGWQRLHWRAYASGRSASNSLIKKSDVEDEPKLIRFLGSAFGLMAPHFQCTHLDKEEILLTVKVDQWDRFQKIFRLQIDCGKALK